MASIVEQSWLIFSEESEGKEEGGKGEATEWGSGAIHAEVVRDERKKVRKFKNKNFIEKNCGQKAFLSSAFVHTLDLGFEASAKLSKKL